MTAALRHHITLTNDELQALGSHLGIPDLPAVLAVGPHHRTIDRREAAFKRAMQILLSRNLIVNNEVQPDLVTVLRALHRPDREWAMRLVTPNGTARITVVRRRTGGGLARRIRIVISLRLLGDAVETRSMARAMVSELPHAKPAPVEPFAAPLRQLAECLSDTHDSVSLADWIRTLGAEPKTAMSLGAALASRQAYAEIVSYALVADEGRICRPPAAVGLFHTKRRRIVAAPSTSPTGELWSTLRTGTDHAVVQATRQLAEMTDGRSGGV